MARRSGAEVEGLRAAGRLAAATLEFIEPRVEPGVSTAELDAMCYDFIVKNGAYPSPLNYPGAPIALTKPFQIEEGCFPGSICSSLNAVVCHGIPSADEVLGAEDIINIDITVTLDGWFGDTSKTFMMPEVPQPIRELVQRTQECLYRGIAAIADLPIA